MSDTPADTPLPAATTAGAMLRQARQAQGMHIAMLAAATKVPQRKLEALEVVRNIGNDHAQYFGPYHSASSARHTRPTEPPGVRRSPTIHTWDSCTAKSAIRTSPLSSALACR